MVRHIIYPEKSLEANYVSSGVNYRIAGDTYLFVEFGKLIDEDINKKVVNLLLALESRTIPGIRELIPTFCSLCVNYDPLKVNPNELEAIIANLIQSQENYQAPPTKFIEVPVVYGGEFGPDLENIADYHNMSTDEVVFLHQSGDYWVGLVGFLMGFPYLGGLSTKLTIPRLQ